MSSAFGSKLQELRNKSGMTADEVSKHLEKRGFTVNLKTISGYETGSRMPNADVFMALMAIYKCQNPLSEFSFVEVDYSIPSDDEWEMIEKYRGLDDFGRETIEIVVDRETQRVQQIRAVEEQADYLIPNAAHSRTDISQDQEFVDTSDDDMMSDVKGWDRV